VKVYPNDQMMRKQARQTGAPVPALLYPGLTIAECASTRFNRVAGPIKVGRAESRATVITDAWTPWDAYTDVLR
jgi:hypothetical protein